MRISKRIFSFPAVISRVSALIFLAGSLFFASRLSAVVVDPFPLRHLIHDSTLIVHGTVVERFFGNSDPTESAPEGIPYTYLQISVDEVLKGFIEGGGSYLSIRYQGGIAEYIEGSEENDFLALEVSGVPRVDAMDAGVFFIKRYEDGICPLVGWRRGFVRFIDGMAVEDTGTFLMEATSAKYPARLHPKDFVDPVALAVAILERDNEVSEKIRPHLSPVTLALLENPDAIGNMTVDELELLVPAGVPEEAGLRHREIVPVSYKAATSTPLELYLMWDLNWVLARPGILASATVDNPSLYEFMLANRRALEAAYPTLIKESPERSIVRGRQEIIPAITDQEMGGTTLSNVYSSPPDSVEPENPPTDPLPEGIELTSEEFLALVRNHVASLLTEAERSNLTPFESAAFGESFTAPEPNPVEIPLWEALPSSADISLETQREREMLEENNGNPVLSPAGS